MENYIRTPKQRGKAKKFNWDELNKIGDEIRVEGTHILSAGASWHLWSKRKGNPFKVKKWTAVDGAVWIQRIS